jgi:hypothetical protein
MMKDMKKALAAHAAKPASKAHKGLKMGGSVAASKMGKVKTGSGMDGLSRVKTKGAMPKMARGGKTC